MSLGLTNFETVSKGQIIGQAHDGKYLYVPVDGVLLFPKYIQPSEQKPLELYRVIDLVKKDDLGDFV